MLISIIVPVYNEAARVLQVLQAVQRAPLPEPWEREVVVVDDGSTDGTSELLLGLEGVRYHRLPSNRGKGAAVRRGLAMARGEIVLIQDADLEYSPECYPELLQPLLGGRADVVYGSRFLGQARGMRPLQWLGNHALTACCNLLFGSRLTDCYTCYKVFWRRHLDFPLRAERFELEAEITAKFLLRGRSIVEVPIAYAARSHRQGKKIRARDGWKGLWWFWLCRCGWR